MAQHRRAQSAIAANPNCSAEVLVRLAGVALLRVVASNPAIGAGLAARLIRTADAPVAEAAVDTVALPPQRRSEPELLGGGVGTTSGHGGRGALAGCGVQPGDRGGSRGASAPVADHTVLRRSPQLWH